MNWVEWDQVKKGDTLVLNSTITVGRGCDPALTFTKGMKAFVVSKNWGNRTEKIVVNFGEDFPHATRVEIPARYLDRMT